VINPEESTQGALSAEVKNAQKRDNVHGLLAMNGFFVHKYPA
jgi:hypothetical protein